MTQPLSHLVVVEAGGDVAARYCARLFADHGARVIQCHVPDDSRAESLVDGFEVRPLLLALIGLGTTGPRA